jgi:hypothetical protein
VEINLSKALVVCSHDMKRRALGLSLVLCLMLAGCYHGPTADQIEAAREVHAVEIKSLLNGCFGCTPNMAIQVLGPPASTDSDGAGGTVLTWRGHVNLGQLPGTVQNQLGYGGGVEYTAPQNIGFDQYLMFYFNSDGHMYSSQRRGLFIIKLTHTCRKIWYRGQV